MTDVADAGAPPESNAVALRGRTARWVALTIGLVMVVFVALPATRQPAQTRIAQSPLLGRPAPEVTGRALDGTTVRLSRLRGRYVVLNFFATWCVPCQREHPELVRFSERHAAARDAQVLAVIFDDDPGAVRRFFEANGGDWPVIEDPRGKVALDFGVRGPPESFLIGPDGVVLSRVVGEVRADRLDALVQEAEGLAGGSR